MRFDVNFNQTDMRLPVDFHHNERNMGAAFRCVQIVTEKPDVEYYAGNYEVTPKVEAQSLPTKERYLVDDVRIKAIPYYDVGNTSGGSTVYIGSEV